MLNFNQSMASLVAEVVRLLPEFRGIRTERLLVSASFQRARRRSGLLAFVLPLRYREGSPVEQRVRGDCVYHWAMLPLMHQGNEILYIVYFVLPRFLNLGLREKLETVVHELYHVHPSFNGDLRRFSGRSRLHGSMPEYDRKVRDLTDQFLASPHDSQLYSFLKGDYRRTLCHYGNVDAWHVPEPRPKLMKVATLSPS